MGKISKLSALIGYSLGIILIMKYIIPRTNELPSIFLGTGILITMIFHSLELLDIKVFFKISRKLYYIFLVSLTALILTVFILLLKK